MRIKKIWIAVLILFLGLGVAFIAYQYTFRKTASDVSDKKADATITATALIEAFEKDEPSANALYLGKVLEVTGMVESVTNDSTISIYLKDPASISGVICSFDRNAQGISTVQSGSNIRIKGICSGYLMDVILNRCSIEPIQK